MFNFPPDMFGHPQSHPQQSSLSSLSPWTRSNSDVAHNFPAPSPEYAGSTVTSHLQSSTSLASTQQFANFQSRSLFARPCTLSTAYGNADFVASSFTAPSSESGYVASASSYGQLPLLSTERFAGLPSIASYSRLSTLSSGHQMSPPIQFFAHPTPPTISPVLVYSTPSHPSSRSPAIALSHLLASPAPTLSQETMSSQPAQPLSAQDPSSTPTITSLSAQITSGAVTALQPAPPPTIS